MELAKVVIKDNYNNYLQGKEVVATFINASQEPVWPGERILAFKDSIAADSNVPVPKSQQSHYIGIEGTVTEILDKTLKDRINADSLLIKVKKI